MTDLPDGFVLDNQPPPSYGANLPDGFSLDSAAPDHPLSHQEQSKLGLWDFLKYRFNHADEPSLIGAAGQAWRATQLPGQVWRGEVDPQSPEGMQRAMEAAQVLTPASRGETLFAPAAREAISAGGQAAQTARSLGTPLPRGVTSNVPGVQATTAKLQELPFAGERIKSSLQEFQQGAGSNISDIANEMGAGDRSAADAILRPGLQTAIDSNKRDINAGYNDLRGQIDQNARFQMPRTQAAIDAVIKARSEAGQPNPEQGLEQFQNIAQDATFNGAQRARADARDAGNALVPHPGFNAGDYNRITGAMTSDLRDIVRGSATGDPNAALQSFDAAERQFGQLSQQNTLLNKIMRSQGEGAAATLFRAANEKGGNLQLLGQLRQTMAPEDFSVIGGTLLSELGKNSASGDFSLAQFVTNWNKVSQGAKQTLFSPQHLQNIQDIVQAGQFTKKSLAATSRGQSGGLLVLLDVAKDAALLGADLASGGVGWSTAMGAGSTVGLYGLTRWLASPAKASSMAAWSRAQRAYTSNPTTARQAVLNITTRNLASNLGVPVANVVKSMSQFLPATNANPVPLNPKAAAQKQNRLPIASAVQNQAP